MPNTTSTLGSMQITIDCSNYFADNRNNGDLAIFAVLFQRLTQCWPQAQVGFFTLDPESISRISGGKAQSFRPSDQYTWLWGEFFDGFDPMPDLRPARDIERELRRFRSAELIGRASDFLADRGQKHLEVLKAVVEPLSGSDLLVLTGGGYFSDNFAAHACALLDRAEIALRLGIPVVMLGCGFEPVSSKPLLRWARRILPALDVVACRERRFAPGFLGDLGVDPSRVHVTGDYAIQVARETSRRETSRGDRLGVAIRSAPYSGVGSRELEIVVEALKCFCDIQNRPIQVQPIIISTWGPDDLEFTRQVCLKANLEWNGPSAQSSPQAVAEALVQCRMVLSGSYHSAALGLAAGVPVIGICNSNHYAWKLGGCLDLFGLDEIVDFREPDPVGRLTAALQKMWNRPPDMEARLLTSTDELLREQNRIWDKIRLLAPEVAN